MMTPLKNCNWISNCNWLSNCNSLSNISHQSNCSLLPSNCSRISCFNLLINCSRSILLIDCSRFNNFRLLSRIRINRSSTVSKATGSPNLIRARSSLTRRCHHRSIVSSSCPTKTNQIDPNHSMIPLVVHITTKIIKELTHKLSPRSPKPRELSTASKSRKTSGKARNKAAPRSYPGKSRPRTTPSSRTWTRPTWPHGANTSRRPSSTRPTSPTRKSKSASPMAA